MKVIKEYSLLPYNPSPSLFILLQTQEYHRKRKYQARIQNPYVALLISSLLVRFLSL